MKFIAVWTVALAISWLIFYLVADFTWETIT